MFKAIYLTRDADRFDARVASLEESTLPEGDVTLRVEYSTLNYKDGLAIANQAPVVRKWPMVAGIDGAGVVESSSHPAWKAGDHVIVDGWGLGETHWGCLAQKARVKGDWLVRLPATLTSRQAMAIGTAGYTAMLCALALEKQGVEPAQGDILVTGATGGVGSIAISILSAWGYRVVASTGKSAERAYLESLGAADVIDRNELSQPGKPMQKERWAGVVDSVGSHTLANACAQAKYRGVVTACGLAQGMDFAASVAPFILRGVRLIGVDSVMAPLADREQAWARLATDLDRKKLEAITTQASLAEALALAPGILAGTRRGRVVVDVNG
ncbi:MAG TPA: MDR family oxidoreductase [Usitatibacteraceae bacterium]|nr:MDR family oxidoreductase [Usitatibacteraceae bacterium]